MSKRINTVLDINCKGLTRALNRVTIVFHDDPSGLKALDDLWMAISNNKKEKMNDDLLVTLLKEMCKSAGIKCNNWNDSRSTRVFKV